MPSSATDRLPLAAILAGITLAIGVLWAFSDTLAVLASRWDADPQYSHGFLVPLIALGILWVRRDRLRPAVPADANGPREKEPFPASPSAWGLPVLAAGLALRYYAVEIYVEWFEHLALVLCAFGMVLTAGGWTALKWAWPACAFLVFMLPLPFRLETAAAEPLRSAATVSAVYLLQVCGIPAVASGNAILAGPEVRVDVVEACSGLRMLMVFFALTTAAAIFNDSRPLWQRLAMVAAAIPIAIASNVVRIALTAALYYGGRPALADGLHDHAELLMVPLALGLLWAFLALLDRIFVPVAETDAASWQVPAPSLGPGLPARS
ncbi:exosortase/archaeosortase family protein [Alienimonas californiensis]|nr:exosortase/archaeosortase family protein [Alienimonas californiensis]